MEEFSFSVLIVESITLSQEAKGASTDAQIRHRREPVTSRYESFIALFYPSLPLAPRDSPCLPRIAIALSDTDGRSIYSPPPPRVSGTLFSSRCEFSRARSVRIYVLRRDEVKRKNEVAVIGRETLAFPPQSRAWVRICGFLRMGKMRWFSFSFFFLFFFFFIRRKYAYAPPKLNRTHIYFDQVVINVASSGCGRVLLTLVRGGGRAEKRK